jgi:hypothetical protein
MPFRPPIPPPSTNSSDERLPFKNKEVVIPHKGEAEINLTLGIKRLSKY